MNTTSTDYDTLATTTTTTASTSDSEIHIPYLCLEHDALVEYGIMTAAIAFFVAMFVFIICLRCRNRAKKEEYMTQQLKKDLGMIKEEEDDEILISPASVERGESYDELVDEEE